MEKIIQMMQDEKIGVPIRTVKSFMSKIPSVLTGKVYPDNVSYYNSYIRELISSNAETQDDDRINVGQGKDSKKMENFQFLLEIVRWPTIISSPVDVTTQLLIVIIVCFYP